MKYKTKPFEIEAVQWLGNNEDQIKRFVGYDQDRGEMNFLLPEEISGTWDKPHVWDYLQATWVTVNEGDYIIKGMKGEYYPCDPEVFEAKYEPVFQTGGVVKKTAFTYDDETFVIEELTNDNKE